MKLIQLQSVINREITRGNTIEDITILFDTGADINVIGKNCVDLLKENKLVEETIQLQTPIKVSTASNLQHPITTAVKVRIFGIPLKLYVLNHIKKIIIGKPTLRRWKFSLDNDGEYCVINDQKFQVMYLNNITTENKLNKIRNDLTKEVLHKFPDLFDTTLRKPPITNFQHTIIVNSDVPIKCKPYKCDPYEEKLIQRFVEEKLKAGILVKAREDTFLYPVFVIGRKLGSSQKDPKIAVDMRPLNKIAVTINSYNMDIKDLFARIQNASYYTVIDLKFAFGQIPIEKNSQKYVGIITSYGNYMFTALPYGYKNAPAVFTSYLRSILQDLDGVFTYLDDILIYNNEINNHIKMVKTVLDRLNQHKLQINIKKVQLLQQRVKFLGYILKPNMIHPDPDKIKAIQNWNPPANSTEVRAFVNFSNHFRCFIPNIAKFTAPLNELLKEHAGKKIKVEHTEESLKAFHDLKEIIVGLPTLHFYDPTIPLIVFTDASQQTIAGYLAQFFWHNGERVLAPIAFSSHKLSPVQTRYSSMERELLSIVTILEKFRYYCINDVEIYTDHQSLSLLQNKNNTPPPRILRFLDIIGSYNPNIYYIQGKNNYIADMLTRYQAESIQNLIEEDELLQNTTTVNLNEDQQVKLQINSIDIDELDNDQLERIKTMLSETNESNMRKESELPIQKFTMLEEKLYVIINQKLVECVSREEFSEKCQAIHNKHHPSPRVTDILTTMCCWHPDHKILTTSIIRLCPKCQNVYINTTCRQTISTIRTIEGIPEMGN